MSGGPLLDAVPVVLLVRCHLARSEHRAYRQDGRRRDRFVQVFATNADGIADERPIARDSRVRREPVVPRSEEHTSELQSLMRISYAVFCLKKTKACTHDTNLYTNPLSTITH